MMTMRFKKVLSAFCAIMVFVACSVASFTNILHANAESLDICEQDDDSILMDQEIIDTTTIAMITSEDENEDPEKNIVETGIDEVGYYVTIRDSSNASAGIVYYDFQSDDQIDIIGYKTLTYVSNLEIPKSINGVAVTRINDYAFSDVISESTSITISIPDGVTVIGDYAFYQSSTLESPSVYVSIPDSITSIGKYAFYNTNQVSLSNLSNVEEIGREAFCNCNISGNEKEIHFSNGLTGIGEYTFYNCSFESGSILTFPDSVTSIGNHAFYGCNIGEVTIPSSVKFLGRNAFESCTSLKSIIFQNGITSLSDRICRNCTSLSSVYIPDSVTNIGDYAFENCESLSTIDIPNSVTNIGDVAFARCTSLNQINIPDSVTNIGAYAFYDCESLSTITIPNSVTNIGNYAFFDCASLTSVTIPDSITSIFEGTFACCKSLSTITIPNSVTNIRIFAFDNCTSLNKINIPDSVTNIGDYAFYNCESLSTITIPNSVTNIGNCAFAYCTSLSVIEIPSSVTTLDLYTFFGDFNLTDIYYSGTQEEWETLAPITTVIVSGNSSQGRLLIMTQGTNYTDTLGNSVRFENTVWYSGNVHYNTTMPATMTIVLEAPDESELYVGNQFTLSVFSHNYTGNLIWTSSDENIATIDSNGEITITGDGTVIIIAIDDDLLAHSVEFTIEPTIVEEETIDSTSTTTQTTETTTETYDVSTDTTTTTDTTSGIVIEAPDESELYVGNQFQLSVQGDYTGALFWASSDSSVATVDSSGVVTITGNGTVTILVMDENAVTYSITFTIDSAMELGDIDGDDQITPSDAYICLVVYANIQLGLNTGLSSEQLAAVDVNGDGAIDTTDSYYMLCYYAEVQLRGVATWSEILSR